MMNMAILQFQHQFHALLSNLPFDQYLLNPSGITPNFKQSSLDFNCDSMNIVQITNLKAGGEREANTARSTY